MRTPRGRARPPTRRSLPTVTTRPPEPRDEPARERQHRDRCRRDGEEDEPELAVVEPQPVLHGRKARRPRAADDSEPEEQRRERRTRSSQVRRHTASLAPALEQLGDALGDRGETAADRRRLEALRGVARRRPAARCTAASACASIGSESDWSHTFPGPVSRTRKSPSPPKILFLIPGTVASSYATPASTSPMCAGCTRSDWPGGEVVLAQLAGELDPRVAGALELLEQEAEAAEQPRAEVARRRTRSRAPSPRGRRGSRAAGSGTSGRARAAPGRSSPAAAPGSATVPGCVVDA